MSKRIFLLFVCGFMSACSGLLLKPTDSPPREALSNFVLVGRFSLRQAEQAYSGNLHWRHQDQSSTKNAVKNSASAATEINAACPSSPENSDTLLLSSPFGQGIAEITVNAQQARLSTSDGQVFYAASAEALTQDVLGYSLPLTQLSDWVRGALDAQSAQHSDTPTFIERDPAGRLLRLRYADWSLSYTYASDAPSAPPSSLFAERAGGFELRLRISEWRVNRISEWRVGSSQNSACPPAR